MFHYVRTTLAALVVVRGGGAEWIWHYAKAFLGAAGTKAMEIAGISHSFERLTKEAGMGFEQWSASGTPCSGALARVCPMAPGAESNGTSRARALRRTGSMPRAAPAELVSRVVEIGGRPVYPQLA